MIATDREAQIAAVEWCINAAWTAYAGELKADYPELELALTFLQTLREAECYGYIVRSKKRPELIRMFTLDKPDETRELAAKFDGDEIVPLYTHPAPRQAESVATTPELAMSILRDAMQTDPEYAWSWHCNLAMMAQDAGAKHGPANKWAANFMQCAFGCDTSNNAHYEIPTEGVLLRAQQADDWQCVPKEPIKVMRDAAVPFHCNLGDPDWHPDDETVKKDEACTIYRRMLAVAQPTPAPTEAA